MKRITKYAALILLAVTLSSCGTLSTLSHRNGEYYLATRADFKGIEATVDPHPWSLFQPGPILAPIFVGLFIVDIPVSLIADTLLTPYDYIKGQSSGFIILVHDDDNTPVPDAHIKGATKTWFTGTTGKNGTCEINRTPKPINHLSVAREGYYETKQRLDKRGYISNFLQKNNTDVYPILLREIRNPVKMYAKRASVDLPSQNGTYGYDLFKGDLTAPHGIGKVSDMIFHVKPVTHESGAKSLSLDISFPFQGDGIQRFDYPRDRRDGLPNSSYVFPYLAPTSGYYNTLLEADAAASKGLDDRTRWSKRYNEANYIFKVRSSPSSTGLYGRVAGFFRSGIHGTSIPNVEFTYFLNPTGSRHLERDPEENLIKKMSRYRTHEYEPNVK